MNDRAQELRGLIHGVVSQLWDRSVASEDDIGAGIRVANKPAERAVEIVIARKTADEATFQSWFDAIKSIEGEAIQLAENDFLTSLALRDDPDYSLISARWTPDEQIAVRVDLFDRSGIAARDEVRQVVAQALSMGIGEAGRLYGTVALGINLSERGPERIVSLQREKTTSAWFDILDRLGSIDRYRDEIVPDIPDLTFDMPDDQEYRSIRVIWPSCDLVVLRATVVPPVISQESVRMRFEEPKREPYSGIGYQELVDELAAFAQPTWLVKRSSKSPSDPRSSRYGGKPWLPNGTDWPRDENGFSGIFVAQFLSSEMPDPAQQLAGAGRLISIFSPQDGMELMVVASDAWLPGGLVDRPEDASKEGVVRSIQWVEAVDHPSTADLDEGEVELSDGALTLYDLLDDAAPCSSYPSIGRKVSSDDVEEIVATVEDVMGGKPIAKKLAKRAANMVCWCGDKLMGWPRWEQVPDWPERDGRRLSLLLQFDGDEEFYGSDLRIYGQNHVFVDPEDPDYIVTTFGCD